METKLEVTNLITPLINTFKSLNAEWKHLFDIGISEYLNSQTEKYYLTNTFIHRSEKVKFDEIYYPLKADYKKLTTDFENLNEIFENYKRITLIGSAGSGKTTLLKYIFLRCIRTTKKIPILIELRQLNDYNGDFEQFIIEKVLKVKLKPSEDTYKRTLKSGSFLFLLDGYDEIFSNRKQEINRQIEWFVDSYSMNNFLLTTRPGSGIEGFSRFYDFRVSDLNDNDVKGFIEKIVINSERKDRIVSIVEDPKNEDYLEYLRNPLLLSMFIMAFESHPEIPAKKSAFYRNVFDTLYSKHDGITKNSFPREKLTKLQRDDFERILNIYSYLSIVEGQYQFTHEYLSDKLKKVKESSGYDFNIENLIYDLRTSISIMILDGFEYSFPHRSMQEYFAAQFISSLPTEKKKKAYENLRSAQDDYSMDNSFNLWHLCDELDSNAFIANFLIPQTKYLIKVLSKRDPKTLLVAFFGLHNVVIFQEKAEHAMRILRHRNFYSQFIEFTNMYNYDEIWHFPERAGLVAEISACAKKIDGNLFDIDNRLSKNPLIMDILIKGGIVDVILRCKQRMVNKIKFWEKNLVINKNRIDSILDS